MTPEEKAKELVGMFMLHVSWGRDADDGLWAKQGASQCAIMCVEQVLGELKDVLDVTGSSFVSEEINHWNQVIECIKSI